MERRETAVSSIMHALEGAISVAISWKLQPIILGFAPLCRAVLLLS